MGNYCMNYVARSLIHTLRCQVFEHMLVAPAAYYASSSQGALISRVTFNVEQVGALIARSAADIINIKLMKCGGIRNALKIIEPAKNAGLQIMLGCMSETSCGTAAGMQLAGLVDLLDQDGPWLLANDPFQITGGIGLGIKKVDY